MRISSSLTSGSEIDIVWRDRPDQAAVADVQSLLLQSWWQTDWTGADADALFRWRFEQLAGSELLLAYSGGRCVAMIASYTRPYLLSDQLISVREPSDWFCLPEFRQMGLGLRLMSTLMDMPEPILAVGGTEDQRALLAALGWHQLPDLATYTLPLTSRWLVEKAVRRMAPEKVDAATALPLAWPRLPWPHLRKSGSLASEACERTGTPPGGAGVRGDLALVPLFRDEDIPWLLRAPARLGKFVGLRVFENGSPIGVAAARVYHSMGLRRAKVIHVHSAAPSSAMCRGILLETIGAVRREGADIVYCSSAGPHLQAALGELKFKKSTARPVFWWPAGYALPQGPAHLTSVHADNGIRPF